MKIICSGNPGVNLAWLRRINFDRDQTNEFFWADMKKSSRRYWLMKSEPGCFSLGDLQCAPQATSCWDGVRNYQARNLLRDVLSPGDGVLFYHSSIARPAIVGVAEVVRGGYPDHTAFDPRQEHFDPRSKPDNPVWYMVDIQYRATLSNPLTRDTLLRHPLLSGMQVLKKGNRLSVQPVSDDEWQAVLQLAGLPDPLH